MRLSSAAVAGLATVAAATLTACDETGEARYQLPPHEITAAPTGGDPIGGGDPRFDRYLREVEGAAERGERAALAQLLPAGPMVEQWLAAQPADRRIVVELVGRARLGGTTLAELELVVDRDRATPAMAGVQGPLGPLEVSLVLAADAERAAWATPADLSGIQTSRTSCDGARPPSPSASCS